MTKWIPCWLARKGYTSFCRLEVLGKTCEIKSGILKS
ncbi:rCG61290 [Rattus norvegicus]|uniref:RCG61290 n=1 Tax=Rattus norvegicus TaxID=10116 RepID=A6KDY6_RAT|nr:rCG61290 [Rattus norvegicus]